VKVVLPDGIDAETGDMIQDIATRTTAEVRELLPELQDDLTLTVVVGGPMVIPATGDGGASVATGSVVWAVDPDREGGIAGAARRSLRGTLFHELHHQSEVGS
jgi:hypothetical protein